VLIYSERKVLLVGCWWLICSEGKIPVADKPSEHATYCHGHAAWSPPAGRPLPQFRLPAGPNQIKNRNKSILEKMLTKSLK
jgi:hypothetical protein